MLNISKNSINKSIQLIDFSSYKLLKKNHVSNLILRLFIFFLILMVITLFLPWTQNINTKGYVTSRSPEQRTQSIQSVIAGKIDKWYVKEGDFVAKGDTIVFISEVKTEYFDPNILERTSEQIAAKSQSIEAYDQKVIALNNQYKAMKEGLNLKREQIRNKIIQGKNKIKMDSIDLTALKTNIQITNNQLDRTKELYDKGLKSLTELQEKEYKVQEETAKVNVQVNKLINQKNEVINLEIELAAIEQEYADKMSKSISEMQTAVSSKLESIAATAKLQNQLSNYSERQKYYYIIAPQSGYITKTIKKGIGEIIKEGDDVTTIVPSNYDLAVELYVRPQDIPLLKIGGPVNLRFDGWPAIVISGWPESSSGVFTGNVVAIDRFISTNGNYRVLVSPEEDTKAWPEFLSFGTGVRAFILLNKVPVWYEIWRQLNGFPPNFYDTNNKATNDELKRKAPIKSVK